MDEQARRASMASDGQFTAEELEVFVLHLPRSIHRQAHRFAGRDGVSLEDWILAALAEHLGAEKAAPGVTVMHTASTGNSVIALHDASGAGEGEQDG